MSLRTRTLLYVSAALVVMALLVYAVASRLLVEGYDGLERSLALQGLDRVAKLVASDERGLAATSLDYSNWTDTYTFMAGDLPEFPDDNLQAEVFARMRLDAVAFVDAQGAIVWQRGFPPDSARDADAMGAVPADLLARLGGRSALAPTDPAVSVTGVLPLGDGPLLFASSAILTDKGEGPAHGFVVFGRWLGPTEIARLGAMTDLALVTGPLLPGAAIGASLGPHPSREVLRGTVTIPAPDGAPALTLHAELPRVVHAQALEAVRLLLIAVCVVGGVVGSLTLLLIEQAVLRRVSVLTAATRQVGQSADPTARMPVSGSDELAELAQAMNHMLETLGRTQLELERAKGEAEQASRLKTGFLSSMSHELRTPLTAILGYAELLAEEAEGDVADDLGRIRTSARHLLALIDDLLDIARIESGRMPVTFDRVDVGALIADVLAAARPLADRNRDRLSAELPEEPVWLVTDPLRLRQILLNLLSNACRFTRDGSVTIAVRAGRAQVRFDVIDSGIGLTDEQLGTLFEPFIQADRSIVRQYGGTGLGLALTRQLCGLLGGAIRVESAPGAGSTFTVALPTQPNEA